jgi:hypothetical protein
MQSFSLKLYIFTLFFFLATSKENPSLEEVMDYVSSIVNEKSMIKDIKVWAFEATWNHNLKPSVAKY